jgi:3-oxoacyl-[acyl-carrier protein] reductase
VEYNKVILITGSSRGIGRYLVERFANRGWTVFGCSRKPMEYTHDRYTHFEVDVADEKAVVRMFSEIRRTKANLYALINNAGAAALNHALTTPLTSMEKMFRVNAIGTMLCSREAAKQMLLRGKGRIINFLTIAYVYNLEGESAYVAAKAAVEAYTRVLSRELGAKGITVNAVAPNPIKTDLIAGVPEDKIQRIIKRQAIPRYGTCDDVGRVIDFYLDPENNFITGQTIYLGGP